MVYIESSSGGFFISKFAMPRRPVTRSRTGNQRAERVVTRSFSSPRATAIRIPGAPRRNASLAVNRRTQPAYIQRNVNRNTANRIAGRALHQGWEAGSNVYHRALDLNPEEQNDPRYLSYAQRLAEAADAREQVRVERMYAPDTLEGIQLRREVLEEVLDAVTNATPSRSMDFVLEADEELVEVEIGEAGRIARETLLEEPDIILTERANVPRDSALYGRFTR